MNDEIHAARYVRKMHTSAVDAFRSPEVGPIGSIDDAGLLIRWRPPRLQHLRLVEPEKRVYLLKEAAGETTCSCVLCCRTAHPSS
jgi:L-asparaginase